MNVLRASLLALSLSACGSAVVVPITTGDAAPASDGPFVSDAVLPPLGDVPRVDAAPPPPQDAGAPPLASLCDQACARQARECGGPSQTCAEQCASIERQPGAERCGAEIGSAVRCLVENGFVCSGQSGSPSPACVPLFSVVQRCLAGDPPPPLPDAGPPPPLPAACEDYCALSDRACAPPDPMCRAECATAVNQFSRECAVRFEAIVGCIEGNEVVCERGLAQPPAACRVLLDAFRPCGMGGGTGDAGTEPPAPDAGAEPQPLDAGAPDV